MKKYISDVTIVGKETYGTQYFKLVLQHPEVLPEILPGQFVEVEVEGQKNVYLRRPISIHDVDTANNTLSLLIQVVGKGTTQLSHLQVGDKLNMVYPLGKGFTLKGNNVLLVGGGCGLAPLFYTQHVAMPKKAYAPLCFWADALPTLYLSRTTSSLLPTYTSPPKTVR